MSIEVSSVTKKYGNQKALNNVSFKAKPGEILGFLGPNGAGKSTMMKIITGFLPPTEGNVKVCDLDVANEPIQVKAKIGYLAEQNPLYYDLYVKEYLHFMAGIFKLKQKKTRIKEVITQVGLDLEQNKKIGELSKGYKQRVGLAQVLLHDPEVLILDEPTTGLDPNQLAEIRTLIKEIGNKKTVMLSTHIMQEVEAICDRVIIINKGEIIANENTKELSSKISGEDGLEFELEKNIDIQKIKVLDGVKEVITLGEKKFKLIQKPNADVRNKLMQLIIQENNTILNLQKTDSKLEDIFKQLTNP